MKALSNGRWLNPPPVHRLTETELSLTTGDRTDFWQSTHYGFHRDDGHALLIEAPDTFTATIAFEGDFPHQYDQAGLLLRIDPATWIKTGIERSDGVCNHSAVVTRDGLSDWSVVQAGGSAPFALRLTRTPDAVIIDRRDTDGRWHLLRLCPFPPGRARIGPMACAPDRSGLDVRFTTFEIAPARANPLHGAD